MKIYDTQVTLSRLSECKNVKTRFPAKIRSISCRYLTRATESFSRQSLMISVIN